MHFRDFVVLLLGSSIVAFGDGAQDTDSRLIQFASKDELEQMLSKRIDEKQLKAVQLQLAHLYGKEASFEHDKDLYKKAVETFDLALKGAAISLETTRGKIELAEALVDLKQSDRALGVLRDVLSTEPAKIYESGLTPEFMRAASQPGARERSLPPSPNHQLLFEARVQREKDTLLTELNELKSVAARILSDLVYRRRGIAGLKELIQTYKDNTAVSQIVGEKIASVLTVN